MDALGDMGAADVVDVIEKVLLFFVDRVERDDEDSSRFVSNDDAVVAGLVSILYSAKWLDSPSRGWVPRDGLRP